MKMPALVFLALFVALPISARAITDPHVVNGGKETCLLCHSRMITPEDVRKGEYVLLEETIDAVCLRCHLKIECCEVGRKHVDHLSIGYSHPSDLEVGDVKKESRPKTLPLQHGKITCYTCHFHRRQGGRDYKLVRLVKFTSSGVDWSDLCTDCHQKM